jgi:hypothetical protein
MTRSGSAHILADRLPSLRKPMLLVPETNCYSSSPIGISTSSGRVRLAIASNSGHSSGDDKRQRTPIAPPEAQPECLMAFANGMHPLRKHSWIIRSRCMNISNDRITYRVRSTALISSPEDVSLSWRREATKRESSRSTTSLHTFSSDEQLAKIEASGLEPMPWRAWRGRKCTVPVNEADLERGSSCVANLAFCTLISRNVEKGSHLKKERLMKSREKSISQNLTHRCGAMMQRARNRNIQADTFLETAPPADTPSAV